MILFFDTETTGLPKNWEAPISDLNNWPRMVQLAYLFYDFNGNKISEANYIIKPNGFIIPHESSNIHGISTDRAQKDGKDLLLVLEEFNLLINKASYIVAHNLSFDEKIVGAEFLRNNITNPFINKNRICTMKSSTEFCKIDGTYGYKWPKLSELHFKLFNTGFQEAHNAAVDINATAKCFWELKNRGFIKVNPTIINVANQANLIGSEDLRKSILSYLNVQVFEDVPIAAKAESINRLILKFDQLEDNIDINEEFSFLRDYHVFKSNNYNGERLNKYQNEFINALVLQTIEEHKKLNYFNNEKIKTIDDKKLQLKLLSQLSTGLVDNKLVIDLYFYYLSAYENFLPVEKKPSVNFFRQKFNNMDLSANVKNNCNKIEENINLFNNKFKDANALQSLLMLNNLILDCTRSLILIKNELGIEHKVYNELSSQIVKFTTEIILKWLLFMLNKGDAGKILLQVEMDDKQLGETVLDVCNTIYNEIDKIECSKETKDWFLKHKSDFNNLKNALQPKSGCYIATMAYGDYDHPQVIHLRDFRDNYLNKSMWGRVFIKFYYSVSPNIVNLFNNNRYANSFARLFLNFFIANVLGK